jgi:hypothetical protein
MPIHLNRYALAAKDDEAMIGKPNAKITNLGLLGVDRLGLRGGSLKKGGCVVFTWGEIDGLERQLKASIVALNKKDVSEVTIIEAIDDAALWPKEFDQLAPIAPNTTVENLTARAPLLICAVASEIGFRFEGVGTVFWPKLTHALGLPINAAQRARLVKPLVKSPIVTSCRGRPKVLSAVISRSSPGRSPTHYSPSIWSARPRD